MSFQDVVPPQLLSKYTAIVDDCYMDKAVEFCAYSFPAVAFTLGRKYWPCIRSTCKKIASNVKVLILFIFFICYCSCTCLA